MTKSFAKKAFFDALYIAVAIAIIFAAWAIVAYVEQSEYVVPSIGAAFDAMGEALMSDVFWRGLFGTLTRCVASYSISVALFFVAFSLSVSFEPFKRIISPVISVLRSLPAVAVTLVFMLAIGGNYTPVALGVLVIFPILYSSGMARTATVSRELSEVCDIVGASRFRRLTALWLPTLAGGLPDSLSSAFSYNVKAVVGAEILAQTARSLGMLMKLSQTYYQPALLVCYVVAAVVSSVLCEWVIRAALLLALKKYRD